MLQETYTDYNIYEVRDGEQPRFKASINDQTLAVMAANTLAVASGRTHAVEIKQDGKTIGLAYFSAPGGDCDALAGVRSDRMAEAASASLCERERVSEIAHTEPKESFVSKLTLRRSTATASIFTTRDFSAACEAVRTWGWAGCRMRRNGPTSDRGQSYLIIVGEVGTEKEVA